MAIMIMSGILVFLGKSKSGSNINANTIAFSGEGKVYTKPDIAFVDFSVVTQGTRIKDVQEANTKKMNKVITFLKDSGIDEKDIKTTNYNLYPQYTYENYKIPQIMGYQISQTLNIKIRNLDKIGEILQGGVDVGINQVNSLYFGVENDEELKEQARKIAIDNAKEKAERLADELGIKLGKLTNFYENVVGYPVPMYSYKESGIGGGGATPDIQAGENEIIVNITLTYEVK
jgi:uncharacterized protein YggE